MKSKVTILRNLTLGVVSVCLVRREIPGCKKPPKLCPPFELLLNFCPQKQPQNSNITLCYIIINYEHEGREESKLTERIMGENEAKNLLTKFGLLRLENPIFVPKK